MTRRLRAALSAAALVLLTRCSNAPADAPHAAGRLSARPAVPTATCEPGVHRLGVAAERDALLFVPDAVAASGRPAPLLIYLHGATGNGSRALDRIRPVAEKHGVLVLSPSSRGGTWDAIRGSLGPDVAHLDEALAAAFARCAVDPHRLAVGGFSDGASYALTLGLGNGDLFTNVIAFSPCLVAPDITLRGSPRVFLSHGRADEILPIDGCGRRLARALERAGFRITYREFDGHHEVPPAIADEAFRILSTNEDALR